MSKHARNVVILFAHTRILCFLASIGLIIKNDEIYRRVALSSCNYEQKHDGSGKHSAFAEIAATVETGSESLLVQFFYEK